MAEPTNAGTLPGLPEDAHPTHTFEAVTTEADFHAGLAQPTKNARLLSALTSYAVDRSWLDHAEAHLMLVALLAEPDLSARDLLAMTRVWFGGLVRAHRGHLRSPARERRRPDRRTVGRRGRMRTWPWPRTPAPSWSP